jgi:hypothetical protein
MWLVLLMKLECSFVRVLTGSNNGLNDGEGHDQVGPSGGD